MQANRGHSALILSTLLALSACGGGGGAGTNANSPSGTTLPPTTAAPNPAPSTPAAALIPEAGPVGETLYATASVLRVLRPDAVWSYRGIEADSSTGTVPRAYENIVSHADSNGSTVQTTSNAFNSGVALSSSLRYENGAYKLTYPAAFIQGNVKVAAEVVELRSPVRINDQYTSLDRKGVDLGVDLDGDKINDKTDLAIYSRVIGKELVDLPNRSGIETVRVDTTMRSRSTLSATGKLTPVNEAVYSLWYAPGIGVVKSSLSKAAVVGSTLPSPTVTEVLVNWDGLTEGLGQTALVKAVVPAASSLAGSEIQGLFDAVGFGTHAVVGALMTNTPPATGIVLAKFDPAGKVLEARKYGMAELFPGAASVADMKLLRLGDELRLLAKLDGGDIGMVGFDASGQRIVRTATRLLTEPMFASNLVEPSFAAASDDTGVWVGWRHFVDQGTGLFPYAMSLQKFSPSGQPVGTARTFLSPADTTNIVDVSLAVDGARLAMSWRSVDALDTRRMILVDTVNGAVLADRPVGVSSGQCYRISMVALRPGLAAVCSAGTPLGVGVGVSAARLGTNGEFLLSSGATLLGEKLTVPGYAGFPSSAYAGSGGELIAFAGELNRYWPEEASSFYRVVFRTRSGGSALTAAQPQQLARIRWEEIFSSKIVVLDKRVLSVETDKNGIVYSTSVWLPN